MKTKEEIINESKESYEKNFRSDNDFHHQEEGKDIVLDKEKLTHNINKQKENEEKRHESLEVLKDKLTVEAEDKFEETFGKEEKHSQSHEKMTTDQMYEHLQEEKQHQMEMAKELKNEELNK